MSRLIAAIAVAVAVLAISANASGGGACNPHVQHCAPHDKHPGYAEDLLGPGFLMPNKWFEIQPTCGPNFGTQSPIDISSTVAAGGHGGGHGRRNAHGHVAEPGGLTVVAPHNYKPIVFSGHTAISGATFLNNGHAMQVNMPATQPTVSGGAMEYKYNVAQFHFHWGKTSATGSEHTLDGKQKPLEMHVVTVNSEYTGNAAYSTKGLAVVGCFFKIGAKNEELQKLLDQIGPGKVLLNGSSVALPTTIDLSKILPEGEAYYSYDGGLTTPPCTQTVVWHVMKAEAEVDEAQMALIRTLKMNHTSIIGQNYRPTQERNGRTVKYFSGHAGGHHEEECEQNFMIPFIVSILFIVIIVGISAFIWRAPATTGKESTGAQEVPGVTPTSN